MATAANSSSSPMITTPVHSPRFSRTAGTNSSQCSHLLHPESDSAVSPSPPSPSSSISAPASSGPESPKEMSDRPPTGTPTENPAVVAGPLSAAGPSGGSSDASVQPQTGSSDQQTSASNASPVVQGKKPAWSKPSNGLNEVGPVMGADSWPALSEAARACSKSSSSDSLKALSDGSVPAPSGPVTVSSLPKPKAGNPSPNSSANHSTPSRQKSMKRGSGSGSSSGANIATSSSGTLANGGLAQPSLPSLPDAPHIPSDRPAAQELPPREIANRNSGSWEHGPRPGVFPAHGVNEHHRPFAGNHRRGGNGGGSHHNSFGSRRSQGRGGYDWNSLPHFNGRDPQPPQHHQQRPLPRSFPRAPPPPPGAAPFISPPYSHPFRSPMLFPEIPPNVYYMAPPPLPDSFANVPFAAPHPNFISAADAQLRVPLLHQIEYYFSSDNLCKDTYLRQKMDENGWVPITLIAGFNQVKKLTSNTQFILDTMCSSSVVEVKEDKIRRRNDWSIWLIPSSSQIGSGSSSDSSTMPSSDNLAAHLMSARLDEGISSQNNDSMSRTTF